MANIGSIQDWMIIDAIRYAIGRRSYQVGVTCGWIKASWKYIDYKTREIIKNEIEQEFRVAEETGIYEHLGDACDIKNWESVRRLWDCQNLESK